MRSSGRRANHARGMTLIEIMVVLVILGMIASAIGWSVARQKAEADRRSARLDIHMLSDAVDSYQLKHSRLPESLDQLVPDEVRRVRPDPWGTAYVYSHAGDKFEITSYGPDRAQGGGDDIAAEEAESKS